MTDSESPPAEHRGPTSWVRSLASGSAHLFGATLVGHTGFFAAVLILTRSLVPSERGTVAFMIVTALIAARIALVGLSDATTVLAATYPADRSRLLTNLLLVTTLTSLVAAAAACGLLKAFVSLGPRGIGTTELLLIAAGVLVTNLTEAARCFLLGCSEFRAQATVLAAWPWLYAAFLLAVRLTQDVTVGDAVGCWAASSGIAAGALIVISVRRHPFGRVDLPLFRTTLHFGVRAWAVSASRFLNFRADQILMGFLATQAALGVYAVSVNASEALLYLPFAIGSALVPVIGGSDEAARGERTLLTLRALLLTTAAAVAFAAVVGPPLLPLIFGEAYKGSVVPYLFLLPGALGFAVISVVEGTLVAARRPARASIGFIVAVVIGFALDLALIPWLHATGAAVAASVAFFAGAYASVVCFRQIYAAPWRDVVPGASDVSSVLGLVRGAVRRLRPRTP